MTVSILFSIRFEFWSLRSSSFCSITLAISFSRIDGCCWVRRSLSCCSQIPQSQNRPLILKIIVSAVPRMPEPESAWYQAPQKSAALFNPFYLVCVIRKNFFTEFNLVLCLCWDNVEGTQETHRGTKSSRANKVGLRGTKQSLSQQETRLDALKANAMRQQI